MSVVTKSGFLKILEARQGCCTQEDKGGKWRQDPGRGGHIRVKKKEGAAEGRPPPIHAVLQLEQMVKMRLEGAANA